jgi:acyl-coenzyme A thioesterase PaaI-like protein
VTGPDPSDERLVGAVRELGAILHTSGVDGARRRAALTHLDAARDLLRDGVPRRRWYEEGEADTRARNRELSTFSGSLNAVAPPMRVRADDRPDGRAALVGSVRLDRLREGPPRAVHGGVLAGLFDELLGAASRLSGGPGGVTGRLTVRYRRPTPLDTDLELWAWIHDERTRRIVVRGECRVAGEGTAGDGVTAEAEAVFLRVDFERMHRSGEPEGEG